MTKTQYIVTLTMLILITVFACIDSKGDTVTLEKIKNHEVTLYCNLKGTHFKKIDADKVKSIQTSVEGNPIEYEFTNGFATRCYIE